MLRPLAIAALAAALAASPASGQGQPQVGPPDPSQPSRSAPKPPPVSFSYSEQEPGLVRQGMVGTLPLAPGVSAGIGLYSVTEDSRRAPETRRFWSPMDVGRRSERVAAVGLKVRF